MKRFFTSILAFCLALAVVFPLQTLASEENQFDEYGFRKNLNEAELNSFNEGDERALTSEMWETFPSKSQVPLHKEWSINFSGIATHDKIDAIVIERDRQYIPVKITLRNSKEVKVKPVEEFSGNTNYTLKVLLANGKKYMMDFTTVSGPRNADIEPNNTYLEAEEMYLNEILTGSFVDKDYNDYYKIEVLTDGKLELTATQLDGGKVDLYLYGPQGYDKSAINYTYNKTTATLSTGLSKGTYYVRVHYSNYYGKYTLENKFIENTVENDNGAPTYISANELDLNNTITGHIGYTGDYNVKNSNDYYKIVIPQDGRLVISAKQLHGGKMDMFLYGKEGNDKSAITYTYTKAMPTVDIGLAAGTYYLRLSDAGYYGSYELTNDFYPNLVANDSAPSSYILAEEIAITDTVYGHIGYTYDNTGINQNDYYKIEVPSSGKLEITATQLEGRKLGLYLYGSKGSDASPIVSTYDKTTAMISRELAPGTYYIRVNYAYYSGAYELKTGFN